MKSLLGLADKNATTLFKVEWMHMAKTLLQSESDAVLMMMDEIQALRDKSKGVVTEVENLKNGSLSWKQNCARVATMWLLPRCARTHKWTNSLRSMGSLGHVVWKAAICDGAVTRYCHERNRRGSMSVRCWKWVWLVCLLCVRRGDRPCKGNWRIRFHKFWQSSSRSRGGRWPMSEGLRSWTMPMWTAMLRNMWSSWEID